MKLSQVRHYAGMFAISMAVLAAGCTKDEIRIDTVPDGNEFKQVVTDQAVYRPGEPVNFHLTLKQPISKGVLYVRYKHLNETIKKEERKVQGDEVSWNWMPPETDSQGYMAEILLKQDGQYTDHTNIAVDVSSDWGKFPRYGYLADFQPLDQREMTRVIDRLNRFHINGIQFYDWQYKHHMPIKWENGKPAASWTDIANRPVALHTVMGYIDLAHSRSMKAMNYNLLFGAYKDADQDDVKKEWGLFKDPLHKNQDKHPLPKSWASDIFLFDPSNPDWQNYLLQQEKRVFDVLPFDGWHVDQLGDRGYLWNVQGKSVNLATTYGNFLKKAEESLHVDLVMNAVGQYGQGFIAQGPVKFLYTEVWGGHPQYRHLKDILDQNAKLGKNKYNTVFAAYMNYNLSNTPGEFNAPGVLLADAVMFALGGSHLELGENMLSKEYFPHRTLTIPPMLEEQLISYYDFLVAYQNLLRDGAREIPLEISSSTGIELSDTAEKGKVWAFAKEKDGNDILHLINFTDAVTMNWNDTDGKQAEPKQIDQMPITVKSDKKVKRVWFATPDVDNGSPIATAFKQEKGQIQITLPHLKYWDMVVIEYEGESNNN